MLDHDITTGCDTDSFCSGEPVTRQQFVAFLWRAAGEPQPTQPGSQVFDDVDAGSYADSAIGWAVEAGVTVGCKQATADSPAMFCPRTTTTRAHIAAFLYRYTGARHNPDQIFDDVDPDSYYGPAVAWMNTHNITTGCTPSTFCPHRPVTRAHAAAFIYRIATNPDSASGLKSYSDPRQSGS